jgi:hypothetical protein
MKTEPVPEKILALEQPHPALWTYYIIQVIHLRWGIFQRWLGLFRALAEACLLRHPV